MDSPVTSKEQSSVRIARINAGQVILVTIITAISGIVGALIQGKIASGKAEGLRKELTSSASKVESLQKDLDGPGASTVEREALYRLTADYIEEDLRRTNRIKSSELSNAEVNYRRLRRAVFVNMFVLRANRTILENTLQALILRGHGWIEAQKSRIISEFAEIKATRLRWLEDVAIPQLQELDYPHDPGKIPRPAPQTIGGPNVSLPREVWILNYEPGSEPTVRVMSLTALRDEADLLKRSL